MPRYTYKCEKCEDFFDIAHSMSHEQEECILCGEEGFTVKVPSSLAPRISMEKKPGEIVEKFIKDAKRDLQGDKKTSREEKR